MSSTMALLLLSDDDSISDVHRISKKCKNPHKKKKRKENTTATWNATIYPSNLQKKTKQKLFDAKLCFNLYMENTVLLPAL